METSSMHNAYGASHQSPKMIVVHAMGEYVTPDGISYESAPDFLENLGLSAHALVQPNGMILRLREDTEGAYHARGFNTDSLGIEILVPGKHTYGTFIKAIGTKYVSDAQYTAALEQCREWVQKFGITKIVRHSDISPGRKVDPGRGFPWEAFLQEVYA